MIFLIAPVNAILLVAAPMGDLDSISHAELEYAIRFAQFPRNSMFKKTSMLQLWTFVSVMNNYSSSFSYTVLFDSPSSTISTTSPLKHSHNQDATRVRSGNIEFFLKIDFLGNWDMFIEKRRSKQINLIPVSKYRRRFHYFSTHPCSINLESLIKNCSVNDLNDTVARLFKFPVPRRVLYRN